VRYVSILGIAVLLGIAWCMSVERRAIRWRPVVWGLALQLLFAMIILQEDVWSFVGMALLGTLVALYLFREQIVAADRPYRYGARGILAALVIGVGLYALGRIVNLGWVAGILIIILFVNAGKFQRPIISRYLSGGLVITLVAAAITHGAHGRALFRAFSDKVAAFLNLSHYGSTFLFGNLVNPEYFEAARDGAWPGFGAQFAFTVLPTIIFFGGIMAVLYHLGIMQRVVLALSRFLRWTIGTSGAETLSCSANIFVGQTEAPLLIKPFLENMTSSELLTIMAGGFATVAGGVLAGYIAMGIDAGHLVAASVMSAPAALAVSKIIYPESGQPVTAGEVSMPTIERHTNVIEAATRGILDGLKLAVNVGAMLVGFIALIALMDIILNGLDKLIDGVLLDGMLRPYASTTVFSPITREYMGIFPGSLKTLFGTLFRPLAFLLGVNWEYADEVGNLLGMKISLNEFVAYGALTGLVHDHVIDARAQIIATYALCGFANFASIGVQIGGIGAFIPRRRGELSRLALRAMFGGAIASFLTAAVAGFILL